MLLLDVFIQILAIKVTLDHRPLQLTVHIICALYAGKLGWNVTKLLHNKMQRYFYRFVSRNIDTSSRRDALRVSLSAPRDNRASTRFSRSIDWFDRPSRIDRIVIIYSSGPRLILPTRIRLLDSHAATFSRGWALVSLTNYELLLHGRC